MTETSSPGALEIAQTLVRMNTINPPGAERACVHYLGGLLEGAGFETSYYEYAPERTNLVARLRGTGTKPAICFGGHVDVVPLGNAPWSFEPFAGDIDQGRLLGRGSCDMKGGVAAYVAMALEWAKAPRGPADLVLVIVAGEETGCEGSYHLKDIDAVGPAGAVVIAEPTGLYPIVGHRGALWLDVVFHGKTAHGATPHLGENAVYKAARAVTRLETFSFDVESHPLLGRTSFNVGRFQGGLNVNSVPDRASVALDIRTVPAHPHPQIIEEIRAAVSEAAEIRTIIDVPGFFTEPGDAWVQAVYDRATDWLGDRPEPRAAPYFTDGATLKPATGNPPTLVLGPGDGRLAHQTDEWIATEQIESGARLFTALTRQWMES